jgi:hypothetical protein
VVYDQNGANDSPEDEREELSIWEDGESWRGDQHPDVSEEDPEDWPENECSAEYWIYKRIRDEDGEV